MAKFIAVYSYDRQKTSNINTTWGFGNCPVSFGRPLTSDVVRAMEKKIKEDNKFTSCVIINLIPLDD